MIELKKPFELPNVLTQFITIYGKGGVGKTTAALNHPDKKMLMLVLENDGGTKALLRLPQEIQANIDVLEINLLGGGSPIGIVASNIQALLQSGKVKEYDVVVIDPITNIRTRQAEYISNTEMGGSQLEIKQWGEVSRQVSAMFDLLLQIKLVTNLVLVAHETVNEKTDSMTKLKTVSIEPALGDQFNHKLEEYCDEIIRLTKGQTPEGYNAPNFDFGSNPNVVAKTRTYGHLGQDQLLVTGFNLGSLYGPVTR